MESTMEPKVEPKIELNPELVQELKLRLESLDKDNEQVDFYVDGVLNIAHEFLNCHANREVFRKSNGFNLLTRNRFISRLLAKTVESMHPDELRLLKAVYTLCIQAAVEYKDSAVRSLQIRGVVDNVFEMIATETKRVPKDVKLEALRFMNSVLSNPNVCKLMCNKYDLSETERFISDYGDTQHPIRANLIHLCRQRDDPEVQEACFQLLKNIASCPRLHRRIVDCQKPENLQRLAECLEGSIRAGSEQPESFHAFGGALMQLCQHFRIRQLLASRPSFPASCLQALEALMDERGHNAIVSLSSLLRLMCIVCFELPSGAAEPPECARFLELAEQMENANRPARVRRWARALANALRLRDERGGRRFVQSEEMFLLHYAALTQEEDEYQPADSQQVDFEELLKCIQGPEWQDVPLLLYAGGLQLLATCCRTEKHKEHFKETAGFDMLTRHPVLPRVMQTKLDDMREEVFVVMGVYRLGEAVTRSYRDNMVRYIQMPRVVEHAVELQQRAESFQPELQRAAVSALLNISERPDVCKLVCNKHNFVQTLVPHLLRRRPEQNDEMRELRQQLLEQLALCPKLLWRIENEKESLNAFVKQLEEIVGNCPWKEAPAVLQRQLEFSSRLMSNVRLQQVQFCSDGVVDAVQQAFALLISIEEVPSEAVEAFVGFIGCLLRRRQHEDLVAVLQGMQEMPEMPPSVQQAAAKVLRDVTD